MNSRFIILWWLSVPGAATAWGADASTHSEAFRVGVSYASFGTVSRNDASAALKAWAAAVAKDHKLEVNVEVEVFEQESDLRQALASAAVDAASMTAEEFMQSGEQPENVFLSAKDNGFTEQYAIIVHRGSGIDELSALKGRKLVRHLSPLTSPALPWLETLLAGRGLGRAESFLGEVTQLESPSKCVLRVFFHQSVACLVTTNAFAVACELNPQLRKDLKVLIASPPLIPTLLFFRPAYIAPVRTEIEAALLDLQSTVAGQQVLTVFQGTRMEKHPLSCFGPTRALLKEYRGLPGPPARNSPSASTAGVQAMKGP